MGFDLTNERIQDTYEQLLQISGSTIVDGTGSVAPLSITSASYADFAVTASYAENAGDIDTSSLTPLSTFNAYTSSNDSTFTAYTSSTSASLADINNQIAAIEAGSGSADWDLLTNKPNGLVSSSAQSVANVSGQSLNGETIAPSIVSASLLQGYGLAAMRGFPIVYDIAVITGSIGRIGTQGGYIQWRSTDTNGLTLQSPNDIGYLAVEDDGVSINSLAFTASNALVSGDLVVNGTASFAYLESITGSAKIIGDAYIVLNNNTPTERYAGIVVQDSGSTNNTASFEFDGQTNDWFYEYTDDGGATEEFGAVMFGPGYNTRGSHVYPSNNTILKGTGDHHIVDSNITDDGTSVTVSTSLTASAFKGDGSALTGIPSKLGNGSGGSFSIETQNLTSNDGDAQGQGSIAIGDSALANQSVSTNAIVIGRDSAVRGISAIGIGYAAGTGIAAQSDYAIGIGHTAQATDPSCIAIGKNATATAENGLAIGIDASSTGFSGVSIGELTSTTSDDTVAIGTRAEATNNNAIAIGRSAGAGGSKAVAIGFDATANGGFSVALGDEANAGGSNSFAQAAAASAAGDHSIAFGELASAGQDHSIVMGQGAASTATNGIAIGSGSSVSSANEINIAGIFKYDGSSDVTLEGSVTSSGNHQVDGQLYSPTFAGSVASSTSSIDFDNGNFATLSLSAATFVANPSNLQSGTTYTLIITSGSQVSNYGTSWKFSEGTQPTLSDGTDILTCVSDGTNLYATALANFS